MRPFRKAVCSSGTITSKKIIIVVLSSPFFSSMIMSKLINFSSYFKIRR